jgi:folate-dependent phosphoribosylglycinamide formyltransferase PurN/RimJ/RimL family protein N-acetyltransferase
MLSFRKAELKDVRLYFNWTNEKLVRSQSFISKPITFEEHNKWFLKKLLDVNTTMLIFIDGDDNIGQVRIEKFTNKQAKIGISIQRKFRGKKYAVKMLDLASNYFFKNNLDFTINAFIKKDNIGSIKSFEKAGYKLLCSITKKKIVSFQYIRKITKILFLGEETNPVYNWLLEKNEYVTCNSEILKYQYIQKNKFDFIISYGYKYIIKKNILEFFKNSAINLHISLLPYNRGANPNFWSFVDNTPKGISIHYMNEYIDKGDIIVQKEIEMDPANETLKSSYEKLNFDIQNLFYENWEKIKNNKIKAFKQSSKGTYNSLNDYNKAKHFINKMGWDTPCNLIMSNKI